jgi:betaine-aldehyde dehydrogenase
MRLTRFKQVGRHYWGVPFGGVKFSGVGREECLDELFEFTQLKSINVAFSAE